MSPDQHGSSAINLVRLIDSLTSRHVGVIERLQKSRRCSEDLPRGSNRRRGSRRACEKTGCLEVIVARKAAHPRVMRFLSSRCAFLSLIERSTSFSRILFHA